MILLERDERGIKFYYKHFDGSKPVFVSRGRAAMLDETMADRVLEQLRKLGHDDVVKVPGGG